MATTSETLATSENGRTVWDIDPAHSSAEFAVRHMMISTVTGRFKSLRGTLEYDPSASHLGQAEAEIDVASIDTGVEDRDNHLRSPDFFDAANHPKILFRSKRVEVRDDDVGRLIGDLTIRGVTKEVVLDVEKDGAGVDPWGRRRVAFVATTTLNRKDFGVNWNQILDSGGVLVGDKAKVTLRVEAVKPRAA